MKKAIKVHNQNTAIWHLFPVTAKPKTTVKAFQTLEGGIFDKSGEQFLWDAINENTGENFEVHFRYFEGGGWYRGGIPQNREIFDDGEQKFDIIGSFSLHI